jgi:hypothetical protein
LNNQANPESSLPDGLRERLETLIAEWRARIVINEQIAVARHADSIGTIHRHLARARQQDTDELSALLRSVSLSSEGQEGAPTGTIPADPDPNCKRCKGSGEESNAQFKCPCRWRYTNIPVEVTDIYDAVDASSPSTASAPAGQPSLLEAAARELAAAAFDYHVHSELHRSIKGVDKTVRLLQARLDVLALLPAVGEARTRADKP